MSTTFIQRIADADGLLVPAERAIKVIGAKVTHRPDDVLTGTPGGAGEVTGFVELDFTQTADGDIVAHRPDPITTANATQTSILSVTVPDGCYRIRQYILGVSIASGIYEAERIVVAVIASGALAGGTLKKNTTLGTDTDDMTLGSGTLAVSVTGGVMTWKVTGKAATSIKWRLVVDMTFNEGA